MPTSKWTHFFSFGIEEKAIYYKITKEKKKQEDVKKRARFNLVSSRKYSPVCVCVYRSTKYEYRGAVVRKKYGHSV